MEDEMRALEKNKTWETCVLPLGKKTVGCRWVFTIKYNPDGTIERYKARLVAKGYTQTYGIDYSETFSPVAKINTIRVLFFVVANKEWPLYQFDVKNAFLHGELKEEVYMEAPQGFTDRFTKGEVCLLMKSLYGLKQSPRAWEFEMKDLGKLKYFLGIEVLRSKRGIFMCQKKYILDLLTETGYFTLVGGNLVTWRSKKQKVVALSSAEAKFRGIKFRFTEVKTASTPMETQKLLVKDEDGKEVDVHMYRSMIGSLMYLTSLRPDIMFAMCACARYQVNPKVSHFHAVKRIFMYLKGQPKLGLWYPKDSPFDLVAYTDSDYAGASLDRKSTTGGCQFLECILISWQCKKQTVVVNFTTKVKYVAASSCCGQVLWIQNQLLDYGDGFEQIVDFLNAHPIRYALTVNPTIYVFCIEQFWSTAMAKTINGEVITESSVRRDLQLADEEGIDCLPNSTISEQLALIGLRKGFSGKVTPLFQTMVQQLGKGSAIPTDPQHTHTIIQPSSSQPQKTPKPRKPKIKDTQVPQPSGPTKSVADEVVHKELGDRLMRAATTASSLEAEQDNGGGPRCQKTIGDSIAQTRFESVSKHSNDLLLVRGNTLQNDEDSLTLDELITLCTTLQNRVLDLEKTTTT
nr:retrovirus-related Pol polyprotein from transposon TNT 1-94 [Tanacetum cinerariifolium]